MKSPSCVRLFTTPWTVGYQAPLSMGFSREEYWSGLPLPSPGNLPDPGMEPRSPALWWHFTVWATKEAINRSSSILHLANTYLLVNLLPYCLSSLLVSLMLFPILATLPFLLPLMLWFHLTMCMFNQSSVYSSWRLESKLPQEACPFPQLWDIFPDKCLRQGLRHRETTKGLKLLE